MSEEHKAQQPSSEFTKGFRISLDSQDKTVVVQDAYEACKIIATSEQQRDDLLTACKEYSKAVILLRETELPLGAAIQLSNADKLGLAAIAKAEKEG